MVPNIPRKMETTIPVLDGDDRTHVEWIPHDNNDWDYKLRLLLQFRDREGHLRIPFTHVEDGKTLGAWIRWLRLKRQRGKLCRKVERRLDEIGFIWNAHEAKWDAMFKALAQFIQREGHCKILDKHVEDLDHGGGKLKLGNWLTYQRAYQRQGTLDAKKAELLESMGVKWNSQRKATSATSQEHFDWNFDLLLVFKEREGHVRVPMKHQESGTDNLGIWLASQRSLYRRGLLELDRQKWLEVADVTWETRKRAKVDHDPTPI
jgi:hypothetical protein